MYDIIIIWASSNIRSLKGHTKLALLQQYLSIFLENITSRVEAVSLSWALLQRKFSELSLESLIKNFPLALEINPDKHKAFIILAVINWVFVFSSLQVDEELSKLVKQTLKMSDEGTPKVSSVEFIGVQWVFLDFKIYLVKFHPFNTKHCIVVVI